MSSQLTISVATPYPFGHFHYVTIDAIREARDATPFKPFVIRTSDGNDFVVPNHDSLLVAEKGKTLIVVTEDQKFHILATDLVSSISRNVK